MIRKRNKIAIIQLTLSHLTTTVIDDSNILIGTNHLSKYREKRIKLPKWELKENGTLEINFFKQEILSKVLNQVSFFTLSKPLELKIIFTGTLNTAENMNDIVQLVKKETKKFQNKLCNIYFENVSTQKGVEYAIRAYLNTLQGQYINLSDYPTVILEPMSIAYFVKNRILHIDLDGELSVISLIKGPEFSSITSIDIGLTSLCQHLCDVQKMTIENLDETLNHYRSIIHRALSNRPIPHLGEIKVGIATGMSVLIEGIERTHYQSPKFKNTFNREVSEKKAVLPKTIESLRKNSIKTQALQQENISTFAGLFLATEILNFYKIDFLCANYANTRIGVIHALFEN